MAKLPFMKFFPGDWIQDTKVLSLEAKGAWLDLICAMWIAPNRGRLSWTGRQFMNFLAADEQKAERILGELKAVANIAMDKKTEATFGDGKLTVKSRRILREEHQHRQALERDRRYKRRKSDAETTKRLQTSDVRLKNKTKSKPSRAEPEADHAESIRIGEKDHKWPTPEALVALYNTEAAANLPAITMITPKRREKMRQFLLKFPKLDFWKEVFLETKKSKFLMGANSGEGHRGFSGNLDWLLTTGKDGTENCVKTYEGRYRDKK